MKGSKIMNKRIMIFIMAAVCVAGFCSCGAKKESAPAESENEPFVNMVNPWVEITEQEALTLCENLFKIPDGATVHEWMKCDRLGDPAKNKGPLIQVNFEYDNTLFTARAQQGALEDEDISGVYADWIDGPDDVTLVGWGDGNMKGKTYRSISEEGYTDLITWYDSNIGVKYSLTVTAADIDGFDIQSVTEQMSPI